MVTIDKPRDSDLHTLTDFAELLCLLTPDRICSGESIRDYIRDIGDSKISDELLNDCFSNLEWRLTAFDTDYPFAVTTNSHIVSAPEDLSDRQKLYVFLLLCSSLPFTEKPYTPLTDTFERISLKALKSIWPLTGDVQPFGKNETNYTGAKWERINALASNIGGEGRCGPGTFRPHDTGDGGIDLAAWIPLDDFEKTNIPSALAQCACSRSDWSKKQSEISENRLANSIHPTHKWMQFLFIPHSFRDSRGKWAVPGDIGQTALFDRLRIMKKIIGEIDWATINPPPIFSTFLAQRNPLV